MKENIFIEIIEFTDPVCTWCWGSEPILRKLETHYEGNIEINFVMGGLVKDIRTFRDNSNDIGGDISSVNAQVASHWLEASNRHGMPVEANGFNLFSEKNLSTYPVNIAYKAAEFQSKVLAKKFLRRMREAVASEAKNVNQIEVLIELAQESGIDVPKFIKNFSDGSAEEAFLEDLKVTRSYKVNGFPSFLVKSNNGKEVMLRGYQNYETFREVIKQISDNELIEKNFEKTEDSILDFIKKYDQVAPFEIEVNFDLSKSEIDKIIQSLSKQKLITIIDSGNGYFIRPSSNPLSCNPITGMCNI